MSTRGYDDTAQIAEIESLMLADPALSRRAAIIRVAGEGSLRRIQNKMARKAPEGAGEEAADIGERRIQMGATPVEMMLTGAERQVLAGSGERVRWSGFTDLFVLMERQRVRALGPSYREDLDRIERREKAASRVISLGFLLTAVMVVSTAFSMAMGWGGDLLAGLVALATIGIILLMSGGFAAWRYFGWMHHRRVRPYAEVYDREFIGDHNLRLHVLTDKAVYVLEPAGRSVNVQRIEAGQVTGVSRSAEGDFVLLTGKGPVALEALPGAAVIVTRLGFGDGISGNEEGTPAFA